MSRRIRLKIRQKLTDSAPMLAGFVFLAIGLALIVKGGDLFVAASVRLAEYLRMPRVVIGSTLVSLATTTPELVVSLMAGSKGEPGLAVGNAVGSCICNVGLILGITAAFKNVDVHPRALRVPLIAMFGFAGLLFAMTLNLSLSHLNGAILLIGGITYFLYDFIHHARNSKPTTVVEAAQIEEELTVRYPWFHGRAGTVVQFTLGAVIVVVGSRLLVDAAVHLATGLGIPSIIVGLTVVAIGTSLPELVTAVTSSSKNVSDLALGNILGANIANLTLIVGVAAVMSEVTLSRATQVLNFPALLVAFGLLLWMLLNDKRVSRKEGAVLLVCYCLYLSAVVFLVAFLRK